MFTRFWNIGIATIGLLLLAGSYNAFNRLPGGYYRAAWWLGIGAAAILAAWASRCTDGRRRQLERENAEAVAVLEIAQMANAAVNLEATLDLVVLTLQRIMDGTASAVFLVSRDGTQLELKAGTGVVGTAP